jgi:hypothetical protein
MPGTNLRGDLQATVAKKLVHRGDHGVSRKTIAQGVPMFGLFLW